MNNLVFQEVAPIGMILALAVAMTGYFVFAESRRRTTAKGFRIIAQLIVILALLGLTLRPSLRSQESESPFVLLTKGYSKRIADSLLLRHPGALILRTDTADDYPKSGVWKGEKLPNSGERNFVLGEGITLDQLDRSRDLIYTYYPGSQPVGITGLRVEPFFSNHRNTVKGRASVQAGRSVLRLIGPGGKEDSIQFEAPGEFPFQLAFTPRQPGLFTYRLEISDSTGLTQAENLPVEILPERKLNVLIVQQYPSFEIKYLKNFLAEKGHGVVLRYPVSKNTYRYEYANHPDQRINRLSDEVLEGYDLLCLTASELERMSEPEQKTVKEAVQSGLGLLILFDKVPDVKIVRPFLDVTFVKSTMDTARVAFRSVGQQTMQILSSPVEHTSTVIPLLKSIDRQTLTGQQHKGLGKVGFQLLKETFTLQLRGQPEAYAEVWTSLLEQTARMEDTRFAINLVSPFPRYVNDPINVEIISGGDAPEMRMDEVRVPLIEDVLIDDVWHGKIWAGRPGWHRLTVSPDTVVKNFFVAREGEWSSLARKNQRNENRLRNEAVTGHENRLTVQPISAWIWFALFLAASGFLWLEPRL